MSPNFLISKMPAKSENSRHYIIGTKRIVVRGRKSYYQIKVKEPNVWEYEHRLVLAARLGRLPLSNECCHHIDGNGLNNSPDNLTILNQRDHNRVEFTLPTDRWAKDYDSCIVCGTTTKKHLGHGLCSTCYQQLPEHKWRNPKYASQVRKTEEIYGCGAGEAPVGGEDRDRNVGETTRRLCSQAEEKMVSGEEEITGEAPHPKDTSGDFSP